MSEDLLKILSDSNKDIDNQKLMDYVSNKVSDSDRFEIENAMTGSDIMSDAIEGLSALTVGGKVNEIANSINADLHKQLRKDKHYKRRRIMDSSVFIYAIILVLVLVVIGYFVIRLYLGR